MAKQLVTTDNLNDFICKGDGKFHMDSSCMIITAGAKDELAKRGVELVYDSGCGHSGKSCAEACGSACAGAYSTPAPEDEEFLIAVAATLQKDYGVSDPKKLKEMSLEVVKTLKANLSVN